jgi:peptidyl-prolyl cis-trans isomerase D
MLDAFRQGSQSKFAKVILALITVPFALWGVESYFRTGPSVDGVATVAGQRISVNEFNQALKQQQDQMRGMLGRNFDPQLFDTAEFRQSVLEQLVNQRLLILQAASSGFAVSDKQLAQNIGAIAAFQDEGKFSQTRYEGLLKQQGYTPVMFEGKVRQDLMVQELRDAVSKTPLVASTSIDELLRAAEQTREVSIANLLPEQFIPQVKLAADAVKNYYDSHKPEFTIPDQVRLEYLVLSPDVLASQMEVSDKDVKQYYDEHSAQYIQGEERQASHILITVKPDAAEADKKAAKEKAEDVLQQAQKDPAQFAKLAEKYSQDPGSAKQGGDLGFFGRGMMVKPFEDAAFAMKKDEVRGPVESEFGYHIIKLTDIKPERGRSLAEVTPEIALELKKQKAQKRFSEIAETFNSTVFEQSASLKPAADALKLTVQQSDWVSRKGGAKVAELNSEKLLQAVFSDEVLKNKRNTEAVEAAPNVLVAARVIEFKASSLRPLADVSKDITAKLTRDEAVKLAANQGKSELEKLKKDGGASALTWTAATEVSRQKPEALAGPILDEVFKASVKKLPAYVGAENPVGGYTLVKISKVSGGGPTDEEKKKVYAQRLRELQSQAELSALMASLRQSADVKVRKDALEKKQQP